jgi:hypothetical protein
MADEMFRKIASILAADPDLMARFYCAASEIVDDFDDYGGVLQASIESVYDEDTAIQRLRGARDRIVSRLGHGRDGIAA